MDDMERYGDYNEVDTSPRKSPMLKVIKFIALFICFGVVLLILLRLVLFNYIPSSVTKLYFTDELTAHYNATGGNIGALTQNLRAPYDDEKNGNFFCDNLIVIPEIGELQITLRYNVSLLERLEEEYKLSELDPDSDGLFSFRLWRSGESTDEATQVVGTLSASHFESFLIYRYYKLVFDGIDFGEGEDEIKWLRLEIFLNGAEMEKPFMIAVYENNEVYSTFKEYKPSAGEVPS